MSSVQPPHPHDPYGTPRTPLLPGTVPNHLVWAILVTLFCCLPLGIVSIVKAAEVNGKLAAGDLAGARQSSEAAKKWAIWGAAVTLAAFALYVLFVVFIAGLSALG